ncbi:MAG: methyltransferase domain-containing protein [Anaerolineae bacterium]|jgi:SAM-dependent methyltransferase|nr:methyltransferase domain-containing protein [Anaerolineae bacterium]
MSIQDRVRWDGVFRRLVAQPYPAPDPLLLQFTPPAPAQGQPRALDLCGGQGQNGLWLAAQGYAVDIMDISRVALNRARAEMTIRNLRNVNLLQMDVDELRLEAAHYDVLGVFRYLKRGLFPLLKDSVRPGGRIVYETYNVRYLDVVPGFNRAFLLETGELPGIFAGWDILYEEETDHNSRLVAVRPVPPW